MFKICYNLGLLAYAGVSLPKLLLGKQRESAYRRPFKSWFGRRLDGFQTSTGPVVWVHAVSLGETKAATPVVDRLRQAYPDATLVFSSVTATAHQEVLRHLSERDHAIYLPFDLPFLVRPLITQIQPDLVILSEGDYWFHFINEAKQSGAKILTLNGKLSARSMGWYRRLPWLCHRLLGCIDHFCLQDEIYMARMQAIGLPSERLQVTGNLKYDHPPQPLDSQAKQILRERLKLAPEDRVVVLGSTHEPEERELLEALLPLLKQMPALKVILVPRHPHRFDRVAEQIEQLSLPYGRYSCPDALNGNERVLLVDAMGVLNGCYQLAEVAVVAGSFRSKVGGHNLLEPIWFGVPTLFGPHMHTQQSMTDLIMSRGAGIQLDSQTLASQVELLLNDERLKNSYVTAGQQLLEDIRGSVERTWHVVDRFLRNESET